MKELFIEKCAVVINKDNIDIVEKCMLFTDDDSVIIEFDSIEDAEAYKLNINSH